MLEDVLLLMLRCRKEQKWARVQGGGKKLVSLFLDPLISSIGHELQDCTRSAAIWAAYPGDLQLTAPRL